MNISLPELAGCQPVLDTNPESLRVLGHDHTFSMYHVLPPRYSHVRKNSNVVGISVKVLLFRKYQSYMLTTFLPCGILIILGNFTLTGFLVNNFSDRIMVTLSLLIVVASLFSQVVSTLPSSVDIKYVDVYFFYCIIRLSCTFILHIISGRIAQNPHDNKNGSRRSCTIYGKGCSIFPTCPKTSKQAWDDEKTSSDCLCHKMGSYHTFDKFGKVFLLLLDAVFLTLTAAVLWQVRSQTIEKFEANHKTEIE